jgi:hypothetical protein
MGEKYENIILFTDFAYYCKLNYKNYSLHETIAAFLPAGYPDFLVFGADKDGDQTRENNRRKFAAGHNRLADQCKVRHLFIT